MNDYIAEKFAGEIRDNAIWAREAQLEEEEALRAEAEAAGMTVAEYFAHLVRESPDVPVSTAACESSDDEIWF